MSTTSIRINERILEEIRELLPCRRGAISRFIEFSVRQTLEKIRNGEITINEIINSKI